MRQLAQRPRSAKLIRLKRRAPVVAIQRHVPQESCWYE
jgi:hypothetical protein